MHERRSRDRFKMKLPVTIHEVDDAGQVTRVVHGMLHDVSGTGMGLVLDTVAHVGRYLVVQASFSPQPKWFYAQVARSQYKPGVGHSVGIKLLALPESGMVADTITRLQQHAA